MNKYIYIVVENNINRFINKCNKYKINLYNINYISKDKIIVKVLENDIDNIKIYNYYSNINIYKRIGIDLIKEKIFNNKYILIYFIICLISMYFITNTIFNINVIHSNKNIRNLVYDELEYHNIKKYTYKKDFGVLEDIKNKILENNKDKLEWLSITRVGMNYVVRVEERIIDELNKNKDYCNIISTKDSLITKIYSSSGEIVVNVNDIVKKDDILISGNIVLNDETKGNLCASGKVLGKVWYNANITINKDYESIYYTGKKRLNISFKHKVLRNRKYQFYDKKYIIKTKLFSIYKEIEYKKIKKVYNDKDGINKALDQIENKFNTKLNNNGNVADIKILKKNINDKQINLEVFVITEEIISKQMIQEKNSN